MNKYAVIVPTLNNFKTIQVVVDDVLKHSYEVIVVDDGSSKPMEEVLKKHPSLIVLRHEENQGKGKAILSGAKKAKDLGYTHIISMDGDGQHLASQIERLIECNDEKEQIIIGKRNFNIDNIPKKSIIGRNFHNFWISLNSGYKITDSLSGFRLYPMSILDLDLKTQRFNFEVEVLVKHYWKYHNIKETLVECYYPKPEERLSHFNNYKDTVTITLLHLKLFLKRYILRDKS